MDIIPQTKEGIIKLTIIIIESSLGGIMAFKALNSYLDKEEKED